MTYITPAELDSMAAILWAGMPLCRYEFALDISPADDIIYGLNVIDQLHTDGVIVIATANGHPFITGLAHCVLCGWCPVHSLLSHHEHCTSTGHLTPHYYIPASP
jgi:hypothetical protein